MPVFRTFFRIIRANLPQLLIYLILFISIALVVSRYNNTTEATDFTAVSARIAVINRDGDSPLVDGLTARLGSANILVELEDVRSDLQDAVFDSYVDTIVIIPSGFTDAFRSGKSAGIDIVSGLDVSSGNYVDMQINDYLRTVRLYQYDTTLSESQQLAAAADTLAQKTTVSMLSDAAPVSDSQAYVTFYYTYQAYAMLAVIILGLSSIMIVFSEPDLRRRHVSSPVRQRSMNAQLALGSTVYALACWFAINVFGLVIYGKTLLASHQAVYLLANSLVFTLVCTSIGYFAGLLIKGAQVQSAVANVVSLGMSFLCGVFVPQSLMTASVLRFSAFLPAYWYVKAVNIISDIRFAGWSSLMTPILIQLGFAVAIFSAALLVSKQKRITNQ